MNYKEISPMKYIEWPTSVSWGPEDEKEYTKDGSNAFDAGILYCMDKLNEQTKNTESDIIGQNMTSSSQEKHAL